MPPRQQLALKLPTKKSVSAVSVGRMPGPIFRATSRNRATPWWFSSRTVSGSTDSGRSAAGEIGAGRFDLLHPWGSCYWADSPEGAIIEATADPAQLDPVVLSVEALAQLTVWRAPTGSKDVAELDSPTPGVTAEISTIVPYDICWKWADALHERGVAAIAYRGRFSMQRSLAIFGRSTRKSRRTAKPTPAVEYFSRLPPSFRLGIGPVGTLDSLDKAAPP